MFPVDIFIQYSNHGFWHLTEWLPGLQNFNAKSPAEKQRKCYSWKSTKVQKQRCTIKSFNISCTCIINKINANTMTPFLQSCKEKLLPLSESQTLVITDDFSSSGCVAEVVNGVPTYVCKGGRVFRSSRERWWYIAVSGCDKNTSDVSLLK